MDATAGMIADATARPGAKSPATPLLTSPIDASPGLLRPGAAILRTLQLADALSSSVLLSPGGTDERSIEWWQVFVRQFFTRTAAVTVSGYIVPIELLPRYLCENSHHLAVSSLKEGMLLASPSSLASMARSVSQESAAATTAGDGLVDRIVECSAVTSFAFEGAKVEVRGRLRITYTADADQPVVLRVASWTFDPISWQDWHSGAMVERSCDDPGSFLPHSSDRNADEGERNDQRKSSCADLVNEHGWTDAHMRFLQIADTLSALDYNQLNAGSIGCLAMPAAEDELELPCSAPDPGSPAETSPIELQAARECRSESAQTVRSIAEDMLAMQRNVIEQQAKQTQSQVETMHDLAAQVI